MSILKLEEGIGLAPTTHGQDLLGSLGTQGAGLAKLVPKGPTQTQTFEKSPSHTGSMADIKQEASKPPVQSFQQHKAANEKKKQEKKTNTTKHHQNERTTESIQNEHSRRRRIYLDNIRWRHHMKFYSNGQDNGHHCMRLYPNGQDNGMFFYNGQGTQDLRGPRGRFC